MMCYRDKTPGCKNECGRQITDQQRGEAQRTEMLIAWGYFCGDPTFKPMDILGSVETISGVQ